MFRKILATFMVLTLACSVCKMDVQASEIDFDSFEFPEREPIASIDSEEYGMVDFVYMDGLRICKSGTDMVVEYGYDEEGKLLSEQNDNVQINYLYDEMGCVGLSYLGEDYRYGYDEMGSVVEIYNSKDELVCRYEYELPSQEVYKVENGVETLCTEFDFVGNINPIRYQGWYFDKETDCYYLGEGVYYDVDDNKYIMNEINLVIPYSYSCSDVSKVLTLYTECMNSDSFSSARSQVSQAQWNAGKRWYDGLSDTEICARLIYSENTASGKSADRTAVAYLIANRINAGFSNATLRGVTTQSQQFSGINPSYANLSSTNNARAVKSVTSDVWKQCVKLACVLTYTSDKTQIASFYSAPSGISSQVQMYGISSLLNSSSFTFSNNKIYQNGKELTDVAVAGEKQFTSISGSSDLSAYKGWNLFYNYK